MTRKKYIGFVEFWVVFTDDRESPVDSCASLAEAQEYARFLYTWYNEGRLTTKNVCVLLQIAASHGEPPQLWEIGRDEDGSEREWYTDARGYERVYRVGDEARWYVGDTDLTPGTKCGR